MIKRTRLIDRKLPDYTRGEEIFNMVTHIVGGGLSVVMLVLCVVFAVLHRNPWAIAGSSVYGTTLIVMYTVSSVYHGLRPSIGKKVMQVIDHCDIYFLIAGTYTPILIAGMRPLHPTVCWVVFGIEWGLAAFAVILNAIDLEKYKTLSMVCYIGMGWAIVFAFPQTIEALSLSGFLWILSGGIAYTIGAVLYGIGIRKRYIHSVFHIFVDIGSILQFMGILLYVV